MSSHKRTLASVYLAGPDVFLPNAREIGTAKKAICTRYHLKGVFPLDVELSREGGTDLPQRIFEANTRAIGRTRAMIANLTPFRGVSADPGTVFEIGLGWARKKPIFAYSNSAEELQARTEAAFGTGRREPSTDRQLAGDGMVVETFGLIDNLMIAHALRPTQNAVTRAVPVANLWTDLAAFEECVQQVSVYFQQNQQRAAAP